MDPSANSQATVPPPAVFHKRRVKNYLINTKLQLRFASWLLAVAAMISIVLGWVLWRSYAETSRVVALADPEVAEALAAAFASEDRERMVWLAAALACVLICLLGFAVVMTHRIAGPAFVIARTCRQVGEGNYERPRPLRERDMLVELADDVIAMVDAVREREQDEHDRIAAALASLGDPAASADDRRRAAQALEALVAEKSKRLAT
jgi:signal transduction histidine kinase